MKSSLFRIAVIAGLLVLQGHVMCSCAGPTNPWIENDGRKVIALELPMSFVDYMEGRENFPVYRPGPRLLEYLAGIDYGGGEYRVYTLPAPAAGIYAMLVWVGLGDNENYLIVSATEDHIRDHVLIGWSDGESAAYFSLGDKYTYTVSEGRIELDYDSGVYRGTDMRPMASYTIDSHGDLNLVSDVNPGGRVEAIVGSTLSEGDIDLGKRKVFYAVMGKGDNDYYVSKSMRMFIVDDKVIIEEIPHEPFNYAIKSIEYGDNVIRAVLDGEAIAWKYYSELLSGEELRWHRRDPARDDIVWTFRKNPDTYIWKGDMDGNPLRARFIDTEDILPSGYYYQNMRTVFHNPETETFTSETPVLTGVFDLEKSGEVWKEAYYREDYELPIEGKWLQIEMTDIGYVVYDYPDLFNDGLTHSPVYISVEGDELAVKYFSDELWVELFTHVDVYPDDGYYGFDFGDFYYSFEWIDYDLKIGQWTRYYNREIWDQAHYILEEKNTFPVVEYDWD